MSQYMTENEDDLSDVSMPEESDEDDSETEAASENYGLRDGHMPIDRTPSDASSVDLRHIEMNKHENQASQAGFGMFPPEIWQHIFTFTPPMKLGSLLCVSKGINSLLDPSSPYSAPATPPTQGAVPRRTPDEVWQFSRKIFRPRMPAPLNGTTELSMWRLMCSMKCAFCKKKSTLDSSAFNDKWHCGPGENGVRPIWSFGYNSCGPCLRNETVKEIDLLLSGSVPSTLLSALPLILFTNELHVVASTSVHPGQHPPSSIKVTKYYLKSDVEGIKKENVRIKELGNAAAEEWVKGLSDRGKAKRLDIARWERWEASGGLQRILRDELDIIPTVFPTTQPTSLPPRPATFHGYSGFGQPPHSGGAYAPPQIIGQPGALPLKFAPGLPQRLDSPLLYGAHAPPGTQKAPRTKEEAERLKLARRTEIERRCSELNPPILPSVLVHMPSFQASLHIIKPLDDTAWDMLKPRLLAQRADAEQREQERLASTQVFQQHQAARQRLDGHPQRSEKSIEREWEETQTIVRSRIAAYSDEVIRDGWASGTRVTKEFCTRFAAEVLIYVRKRFYAEIAKDDAAARAAGVPPLLDPPNGPFTRKLTLENMRWVYETKIKPHTLQYRKEIFLCNACDTFQWFTFEGLCEHYTSHQTYSLNSDSTMVTWRAEWPEEPFFNPEPHLARRPKVAGSDRPTSSNGATSSGAPKEAYAPPQGILPLQAVSQLPSPSTYPPQVLQAFQPPPFSDPYNPPLASYVVPGPYGIYPPTTQPQQYPEAGDAVYAPFYQHPPPDAYPNPQMPMPQSNVLYSQGYHNPAAADPALMQHQLQQQNLAPPLAGPQSHIPPPVYRTEEYKAQLQDLASIARTLWNEIAGAKDIPGSVRVHVILFHLLQRWRENYTQDPPLSMFVDGIQNAKEMRIVRNVNGIACKTCAKENASKPINPYTVSTKTSAPDRKLYSLPQLVNHFQSAHSEASDGGPAPDWRTDMVELPDLRKIQSLKDSADMDEHKLRLVIEALPEAFKPDTPVVKTKDPLPSVDKHDSYCEHGQTRDLPPSVDKHDSYYQHDQAGNLSPSVDKHDSYHQPGQRRGRLPPVDNRDSYYQPDRSPTPITQLNDDVRKLFNPAVDNYPRQGFSRLPSRTATGSISGPSNMKRKATSPLGGRRAPIQPIPADGIRYFDPRALEKGDYPPRHIETELRPEYNHQAVDLSRLLSNTGRAGPAQEHNALPPETRQSSYQCMAELERSLDSAAPPKSWEALMGSDGRPRDLATADPSTENDNQRDSRATARAEYDARGDNTQQREGQDGSRRSPAGGYSFQPSAKPADPRYVRERTTFVGIRTVHSQAPPREPRYAGGKRASGSPGYVVEEAPRARHNRAVSPGVQRYIDEPRPVIMRVEEDQYGQRQQYYEYPEQHVRPRQVQPQSEPEPEIEYVRVRDPAGDYLVARPKPRQQPIYTRYEDDMETLYEGSRRRDVYEDEHVPTMRVSQVSQRPRQIVYADDAGRAATRYEDDGGEPTVRYGERPQPVITRADDGRAPTAHEEPPRPRQQVVYEGEVERRQPVYQRRPMNGPPISRDDPAYYEEYDPRNPAPLPEAPRRAQRPD